VRIIEELHEWKSSGSGSKKPRLRPWGSVALLKLALTSSTGCGRAFGIVRLRTKTMDFSFSLVLTFFNICTKMLRCYFQATFASLHIILRSLFVTNLCVRQVDHKSIT
jgi:hypothetical protein